MRPYAGQFPLAATIAEGWQHFAAIVDSDVAAAVEGALEDPAPAPRTSRSPARSVIDEFHRLGTFDEESMRLALLCGLLAFGWNKAPDAATAADTGQRERHRADLDWWVNAARTTLHRGLR
jgi:hypothetical protein